MLRPYQQEALKKVSSLASFGLFMGTGTGKTITSLVRTNENLSKNLLVICPKNVTTQWKLTIDKYFPKFKILEFPKNSSADAKKKIIFNNKEYNCIILNYDIVYKLGLHYIVDENWTIILDESHRIKNYKTKVSKACMKIGEKAIYKIILTATPTQGNFGGYIDYFPQLYFLGYIDYSIGKFKQKYVVEKQVRYNSYPVKVITGYQNKDELDNILKYCCVRYEAKFGDFEPQHNLIEFEQPKNYKKLLQDKILDNIIIKNAARKRIATKTICTGVIKGKDYYDCDITKYDNDFKISWLDDFLQDTNEVVAIYYQYNVELEQLETLMKKLGKKYVVVNGDTQDKYKIINGDHYDVMLGQYQAASEALDGLQHRCHIEILFAMPESSIHYIQTIGRINRDGQTKVPMYYYLVCKGTIEKTIYDMLQKKIEFSYETLDKLIINC
jgi:SNF2 family DNA or RNA helicase